MYSYSRDQGLTDHPCRFCGRPGACYTPPAGWPSTIKASALLPEDRLAHLDCASQALGARLVELDIDGAMHPAAVQEIARLNRCRIWDEGYPLDLSEFLGTAAVCAGFLVFYVVGSAVFA